MGYKTNSACENNNALWLQITAGQGPKECAWVVAQLSEKILQAATKEGVLAERIEALAFDKFLRKQECVETEAFLSVLLRLEGEGVNDFANTWLGAIKWQGESPYRPKHKRINWFVNVAAISMPQHSKAIDLLMLEKEIDVETMRSKGPGGQHVNKTNSAVRITHRPTGIKIRVDTDRSQHRNKKIALERLQLLLASSHTQENQDLEKMRWLHHYGIERGNAVRTFYGKDFSEK